MSKLKTEDRNELVRLLESLPLLQTNRGRRQLLAYAGLDMVISKIDLEGPPFVVASEIVNALENYGKVTYEHEALGMLLNAVKEFIGPLDEKQAFIDRLLEEYVLMIPVKKLGELVEYSEELAPEEALERIIGENTLRHISFLGRGLEVARTIAFVVVGGWTGTGFMISCDLFLTANHVLPDRQLLGRTKVRFNYQLTFDGAEEKTRDYSPNTAGVFYANKDLDYTLVQIEGSPGDDWGVASLNPAVVEKDSRVNIIQHPAGQPKQISFQNNFVEYADSRVVQYLTSTMCGSSGAPVFDDQWRVIALHHAGGVLLEPGTNRRYFRNQGIAIKAILEDFPDSIRNSL